jgi:hypothetical protein
LIFGCTQSCLQIVVEESGVEFFRKHSSATPLINDIDEAVAHHVEFGMDFSPWTLRLYSRDWDFAMLFSRAGLTCTSSFPTGHVVAYKRNFGQGLRPAWASRYVDTAAEDVRFGMRFHLQGDLCMPHCSYRNERSLRKIFDYF